MNGSGDIKISRKRFTERRKQEMRHHYLLTENYAETTKAFSLNKWNVRSIVKFTIRDVKLFDKGNHTVAGRPLTYPEDVERELFSWILQLLHLHLSVSVLNLQEKAKKEIRPHNLTLSPIKGWTSFSQDIDYHFEIVLQSAKSNHSNLKDASPNSARALVVTCVLVNTRIQ